MLEEKGNRGSFYRKICDKIEVCLEHIKSAEGILASNCSLLTIGPRKPEKCGCTEICQLQKNDNKSRQNIFIAWRTILDVSHKSGLTKRYTKSCPSEIKSFLES